jgi:hypothetical protein
LARPTKASPAPPAPASPSPSSSSRSAAIADDSIRARRWKTHGRPDEAQVDDPRDCPLARQRPPPRATHLAHPLPGRQLSSWPQITWDPLDAGLLVRLHWHSHSLNTLTYIPVNPVSAESERGRTRCTCVNTTKYVVTEYILFFSSPHLSQLARPSNLLQDAPSTASACKTLSIRCQVSVHAEQH